MFVAKSIQQICVFQHADVWQKQTTSSKEMDKYLMFWATICESTKMHPLLHDLTVGIPLKSFLAKALKLISSFPGLGWRLADATSVDPLFGRHTWSIETCLEYKKHWSTEASIEHVWNPTSTVLNFWVVNWSLLDAAPNQSAIHRWPAMPQNNTPNCFATQL